jgi:hypothetical protein
LGASVVLPDPMKRVLLLCMLVVLSSCGLFGSEKKKKPGPEEPIATDQLLGVLPAMDGWTQKSKQANVSPIGPDKVSVAAAEYEKPAGDKLQKVALQVMDGNYVSSAYSPFALMAHSQGQVLDAHKGRIEFAGHPGLQEWKPETGTVTVRVLVERRFVVTLHGENVSPPEVRQTIEAVDLEKLATWARADAPKR